MHLRILALPCLAAASSCLPFFPLTPPLDGGTTLVPFDAGVRPEEAPLPANEALAAWAELGAEAKISAAFEAGTLDEKTAALYGALAQLAPSQLPVEYRAGTAEVVAPSYAALLVAKAFAAEYTPAQRALWDTLVARPGTPQFRSFAAAASPGNCWEGQLDGTTTTQLVDETASLSFKVITNKTGAETAPALAALSARAAAALASSVTVTDGALKGTRTLKDHFQAAATSLGSWGFPAPTGLPAVAANGGKVPVFITDCSGAGFKENGGATSEGELYLSLPSAFEDPALRKLIVPHELAHLYTSNVAPRSKHDAWPVEAIAVALEDELVRDVHRWTPAAPGTAFQYLYGPMNRAFWCPEEPFHSNNNGKCKDGWDGAGGKVLPGRSVVAYSGDYSRFVFFKWHQAKAGGSPQALAAWWFRYVNAGGDPTSLVSLEGLAQFQDDLLTYSEGADTFTTRDRALFSDPAHWLDIEPALRGRYTFRFELQEYQSHLWRLAPGQNASSREPKSPDSATFLQQPGSTHRVLVELPDLVAEDLGWQLAALTYEHQGASPKITFRYLVESGGLPSRRRLPASLQEISLLELGWLPFSPTTSSSHYVLVQATTPPTRTAPRTRGRWGVSIPRRCGELCMAHYRPQALECCPAYCAGSEDPQCLPQCRQYVAPDAPLAFCGSACFGKNEPYANTDGTAEQVVGPALCSIAGVPEETSSGLVPLSSWPPVSCTNLDLPPRE